MEKEVNVSRSHFIRSSVKPSIQWESQWVDLYVAGIIIATNQVFIFSIVLNKT